MSIVAPISATNALIPFAVGIAGGERPAAIQLAGVVLAARRRDPGRRRAGAARRDDRRARRSLASPAVEPAGAARSSPSPAPRRSSPSAAAGPALGACAPQTVPARPADGHHPCPDCRRLHGPRRSSATMPRRGTTRSGRCSPAGSPRRPSSRRSSCVLRPHVKVERSALPFIVAVGILDTGANGLFALATTQGYLSLVAVLGSLYPVVTVLLAFGLLRERIAPHQLAGAAATTLAGVAPHRRRMTRHRPHRTARRRRRARRPAPHAGLARRRRAAARLPRRGGRAATLTLATPEGPRTVRLSAAATAGTPAVAVDVVDAGPPPGEAASAALAATIRRMLCLDDDLSDFYAAGGRRPGARLGARAAPAACCAARPSSRTWSRPSAPRTAPGRRRCA